MSALDLLHELVMGFNAFALAYLLALNASYSLTLAIGWHEISSYVRRRVLRDYRTVERSELSVPVSILVPAYDEQPVIVESVRALLRSNYPSFEVVVVNDGSGDGTLAALVEAFGLVRLERVPRARLQTEPVRGVYGSPRDPRICVVDKHNGGKSDALNAGLCYARYPLYCAVDSDTMLDQDALPRLVWHFQVRPETVACGGIVRIVNGSTVSDSQVAGVETPGSLLVNIQIVEFLRAFLAGRTGWSRLGMLLSISGAFGVFRRELVVEAGGYDTTTVGEDTELIVRLHRFCRDRDVPYRMTFVADPVCWTEAPTTLRALAGQRDRWQRGLIETLVRHRGMIGRPRYGRIGMVAMPYFVVFEMLGPVIELLGYLSITVSLALGWVSHTAALAYFGLAITFGLALTFGALRIEERAYRRYRRWRCLGRLVLAAAVDSFGYRQWSTWIRARAFWTLWRRREHRWGEIARIGYAIELPAPTRAEALAPSGPALLSGASGACARPGGRALAIAQPGGQERVD